MPAWCRSVDPNRDLVWSLDEEIEALGLPLEETDAICLEELTGAERWDLIRGSRGSCSPKPASPRTPFPARCRSD
jgi:hypothetical protein